jgi:predicted nicotinamide N-methyase
MFSLESFNKEYETDTHKMVVNGRKFNILLPKYLSRFINPHDVFHAFPLWAKIWPASWMLADYLAALPLEAGKKYLEIGAGVGLVSIVASSFGHQITMTENNADALQFARANALINDCPQLPVLELDWTGPLLEGQFDYIVGSEVTYKRDDLQPLLRLFKTYLKSGGEILLTGEMRKVSGEFYKKLGSVFNIRVQKKILRSDKEEIRLFLFRMRYKS